VSYLSALEAKLLRLSAIQIHVYLTTLLTMSTPWHAAASCKFASIMPYVLLNLCFQHFHFSNDLGCLYKAKTNVLIQRCTVVELSALYCEKFHQVDTKTILITL